jgi:hypothetical protein
VVQDDRWDGGFLATLNQVAQESPISQQLSWPRTLFDAEIIRVFVPELGADVVIVPEAKGRARRRPTSNPIETSIWLAASQ